MFNLSGTWRRPLSVQQGEAHVAQTEVAARLIPKKENFKPKAGAANAEIAMPDKTREFDGLLSDAQLLLDYAVKAGIEVDANLTTKLFDAIAVGNSVWNGSEAAAIADAIAKLAAKLKPVTAETIRACQTDVHKTIRHYQIFAIALAILILPLSFFSFIAASISNQITADVDAANASLLVVHTQIDSVQSPSDQSQAPSSAVLVPLQEFGIQMRSALHNSILLSHFSLFSETPPCQGPKQRDCELDPTQLKSLQLIRGEVDTKTLLYQDIRNYANYVTQNESLTWGAIGNIFLPLLYALLGACAAALRLFTQQISARTFAPTYATNARFYIAGIGGGVIGLFNNIFGQNLSVSPLALAFLVGYAADVFFSFLDATTQNVGKTKVGS
jgi:hypothetical protein